jgi:hypothetical protein
MIKDIVIQNGLLRIATGTFVCMVGDSYNDPKRVRGDYSSYVGVLANPTEQPIPER